MTDPIEEAKQRAFCPQSNEDWQFLAEQASTKKGRPVSVEEIKGAYAKMLDLHFGETNGKD